MTWTLTTSGAAIAKAGANEGWSTDTKSGAYLAKWNEESEGRVEAETRRSWVSNYSALDTGIKNVLSDVTSSMIAKRIIAFDTTKYVGDEATLLIDLNDDIETKGLRVLSDFKSNTLKTP